jgi:hypothetical protein
MCLQVCLLVIKYFFPSFSLLKTTNCLIWYYDKYLTFYGIMPYGMLLFHAVSLLKWLYKTDFPFKPVSYDWLKYALYSVLLTVSPESSNIVKI